jgi:hypothetical protein
MVLHQDSEPEMIEFFNIWQVHYLLIGEVI